MALNKLWTMTIVQVVAVHPSTNPLSDTGSVDVLPLVNQLDGYGQPVPHTTVFGLPYFAYWGGDSAIILPPAVNDLGLCIFSHGDISSVLANRAQSNPGSMRRFSPSDGVYLGGVRNGVPTQYIQFTESGINIVSPTAINLNAPAVNVTGPLAVSETVVAQGEVTGNHITLSTHVHGGVSAGGSNTGGPTG